MSDLINRGEGDARGSVSPDDDWFAGVADEPVEQDAPVWEDDFPTVEPEPAPPGLGTRQVAVVLAALAAVAIVALLILGIRAITGDDEPTSPVTTAETPAVTDTTPSTTTTPSGTGDGTTTTTPDTGATTPAADPVPTGAVLRPADEGESVTALQKALIALGFELGDADGIYGDATVAAVEAFQEREGLTTDGSAGPLTIAAINEALAAG